MADEDIPTRWVRKKDGVKATVIAIGGGAYNWLDIRLSNGRITTISEAGLRKKYDPEEDQS